MEGPELLAACQEISEALAGILLRRNVTVDDLPTGPEVFLALQEARIQLASPGPVYTATLSQLAQLANPKIEIPEWGADLSLEQRELAELMSEISEKHYCAGWMSGLEIALWDAVLGNITNYGQHAFSTLHLAALKAGAERIRGWITWDDKRGEVFVPMDQWLRIFRDETGRSPYGVPGCVSYHDPLDPTCKCDPPCTFNGF